MTVRLLVLYGIAFISCMVLGYLFINTVRRNNIMAHMAKNARDAMENTASKTLERKKNEEEEYRKYGKKDKTNIIYKLDIALEKTGLRNTFPFLVTEVFLLIVAGASIAILIIVEIVTNNMLYAIFGCVLNLLLVYLLIYILNERVNAKIDDNLLQFADLLESYSLTSDDIINIFENLYPYLDEPLHSIVLDCVNDVKISGDTELAFQRMRVKTGNRSFGELVLNIEECSKNNADYATVVRGIKATLDLRMTEKEDRKRMANGARFNIAIMLLVYVVSINIISDFVETDIITYLQATPVGIGVLCFLAAVMLFVLYKLITMGRD